MPKRKRMDTPPWWREGFVPCVCKDPASVTAGPWSMVFMMAPTFEGTLAVQRHPNMPGVIGVRERVIPNHKMKNYTLITDEDKALQSYLLDLKKQMLTEGATHEAVRLVGEHIPISEKELQIMATKLKRASATTKTPAKKAPAKKAAAKSTESTGGGRKSTLDEKAKITATEKGTKKIEKVGKDDKLALIVKAKTVAKALEIDDVLPRDIHYAVKTGLIELG